VRTDAFAKIPLQSLPGKRALALKNLLLFDHLVGALLE